MNNVLPTPWQEELSKCAKCGKCRAVCPVFQETGAETMVARGRLTLAEAAFAGQLGFTDKFQEALTSCLKCFRCSENCPSGVSVEKVIQAAREAAAEKLGLSLALKLLFRVVMPHRKLFDMGIRLTAMGQKLISRKPQGQLRHLPLFLMGGRQVPPLARKPALQRDWSKQKASERPVGLFLGCLINYVFPEVAEASVRVLNRAGFGVVVPQAQLCCGTPIRSVGDRSMAEKLARHNVEIFSKENIEAIVTPCASCGRALKSDYEELLGAEAKPLSSKVYDISEFLVKSGYAPVTRDGKSVTYHEPCHLGRGQGVTEEPRELLRAVAKFTEIPEPWRCCGGGGAFSLLHYDISKRIAARKIDAIIESGAEVVTTACPGCQLQLLDALAENGLSVPVRHVIELVSEATE